MTVVEKPAPVATEKPKRTGKRIDRSCEQCGEWKATKEFALGHNQLSKRCRDCRKAKPYKPTGGAGIIVHQTAPVVHETPPIVHEEPVAVHESPVVVQDGLEHFVVKKLRPGEGCEYTKQLRTNIAAWAHCKICHGRKPAHHMNDKGICPRCLEMAE